MDKKKFSTFSELRKEAYSLLGDYRKGFVRVILLKNSIAYPENIRKRDFHETMEEHKVEIVNNEKLNRDEIYISGELVAYWSRNYILEFRGGNLICKIHFHQKQVDEENLRTKDCVAKMLRNFFCI